MKRNTEKLNDGDDVVIHQHSKEHTKEEEKERMEGERPHMEVNRVSLKNRLIETGVWKESQRHLQG